MNNKVNNEGVVASDVGGVGTSRYGMAASEYGSGKGIQAYGHTGLANQNVSNLISDSGVVAADVTGVGTARYGVGGAHYGT